MSGDFYSEFDDYRYRHYDYDDQYYSFIPRSTSSDYLSSVDIVRRDDKLIGYTIGEILFSIDPNQSGLTHYKINEQTYKIHNSINKKSLYLKYDRSSKRLELFEVLEVITKIPKEVTIPSSIFQINSEEDMKNNLEKSILTWILNEGSTI